MKKALLALALIPFALALLPAPSGSASLANQPPAGFQEFPAPPVPAVPAWNLKSYGAKGDGVTDDTPAFVAAQAAVQAAGGGTIFIPASRTPYIITGVGLLNRSANTTFQGAGMWLTTIKTLTSIPALYQVSGAFSGRGNQAFQDLCFDSNGLAINGVVVYGQHNPRVTFRRVRFTNLLADGIGLSGTNGVVVEDCYFHGPGTAKGTGISVNGGACDLTFRHNRFEYVNSGIVIDNGVGGADEEIAEHIEVADNYFDLGWWLLKAASSGSSGAVSYTATVLTDTGAAFSGLIVYTTIRAMPVRRTGTITTTDNQHLSDSGATFLSYGILRGEIVRSGTKWAAVAAVESDTKIRLEQWLDSTTYQPTTAPAAPAAYTVYGIYIGKVMRFTATTITTDRWHDLNGATVTPSAGTRYEVLVPRCVYPIHAEYGTRNIRITRNTFRRGWADQVSMYGGGTIITENLIEDGQDMGITVHGLHNVVANNRIIRQGAGGIWSSGADSVFANNVIEGWPWENYVNPSTLGAIILYSANRCLVIGNILDGLDLPFAKYGIIVTGIADGNTLALNKVKGVSTFGIHLYNATVTNTKLRDNEATVGHGKGAVGGDYGTLVGTGSPEGVVTAGVGTLYRRKDGGASTSLYIKESGTGNTGWRAI